MNSPDGGEWDPFDGISYYGGYGASIAAGQSYLGSFGGGGGGYFSTKYSIRFATDIYNRNGLIRNLNIPLPYIASEKVWISDPVYYFSTLTHSTSTSWLYEPIDNIYGIDDAMNDAANGGDLSDGTTDLGQIVLNVKPYYQAIEKGYSVANFGVAVSAIAMQSMRLNTNIHLRIGNLPDYWARYSLLKNISSGRAASYFGYGFAGINTYYDYKAFQTGDIGAGELGFNTMTNFYGVYIGTAVGGPPGFALGFMFDAVIWGSKYFLKNVVSPMYQEFYMRMYNMTHPTF